MNTATFLGQLPMSRYCHPYHDQSLWSLCYVETVLVHWILACGVFFGLLLLLNRQLAKMAKGMVNQHQKVPAIPVPGFIERQVSMEREARTGSMVPAWGLLILAVVDLVASLREGPIFHIVFLVGISLSLVEQIWIGSLEGNVQMLNICVYGSGVLGGIWMIGALICTRVDSVWRWIWCSLWSIICLAALVWAIATKLDTHIRLEQVEENEAFEFSINENGDESVLEAAERVVAQSSVIRELWGLLKKTWPHGESKYIYLLVLAMVFLGLGRILNAMVPIQFKYLTDSASEAINSQAVEFDGSMHNLYWAIINFALLRILQGSGGGLMTACQEWCWIPIGQKLSRNIAMGTMEHLHGQSIDAHMKRRSGEIFRIMDRGVESVSNLLNIGVFGVLPTILDILIASCYFATAFDLWTGFALWITIAYFLCFTILITIWRSFYRRAMNDLDSRAIARAVDSLINYETVKYYNAEKLESVQYGYALGAYQSASRVALFLLYLMQFVQNGVMAVGILVGCWICANRIGSASDLTLGDFILYLTWTFQLYAPIQLLGGHYRSIQQNLVDMENLIRTLNQPTETRMQIVQESRPIPQNNCDIVFDHVWFSYDSQLEGACLKDVSFVLAAGQCLGVVGPSGGGKSTILKLLFRFYDVSMGSISIGGRDIRDWPIAELRSILGVVPQDIALFHETILYNIRYGKPGASDEEVMAATDSAQIYDLVFSGSPDALPLGGHTIVGEKGFRLSGGERQRIAIARAMLKNASILILDEATSALDSNTEASVQQALRNMMHNRTTILIAHRLSTLVHANHIIVLGDGFIVEQGTHDFLIQLEHGVYRDLWLKQQICTLY